MRVLNTWSWEESQKRGNPQKRANEDRFEDQWYYRRFVKLLSYRRDLYGLIENQDVRAARRRDSGRH